MCEGGAEEPGGSAAETTGQGSMGRAMSHTGGLPLGTGRSWKGERPGVMEKGRASCSSPQSSRQVLGGC